MVKASLKSVLILLSVAVPSVCVANGLCERNPEFRIADVDKALKLPEQTAWYASYFPDQLVEIYRKNDVFILNPKEVEDPELSGYEVDLNNDQSPEYMIFLPAASGSGGSSYMVVSLIQKKWTHIGIISGGIIPLTTSTLVNNERWRDLGGSWRFGPDDYIIVTYCFDQKSGRYVECKTISCKNGKVNK